MVGPAARRVPPRPRRLRRAGTRRRAARPPGHPGRRPARASRRRASSPPSTPRCSAGRRASRSSAPPTTARSSPAAASSARSSSPRGRAVATWRLEGSGAEAHARPRPLSAAAPRSRARGRSRGRRPLPRGRDPAPRLDSPRPMKRPTRRPTSAARYEPREIERRWQERWAAEQTWEVPNPGEEGFDASKPKAYVLEMLPYPSGEPHVGHLKNYSIGDAIAHFRRRHGFQVIHPMGYDAFGLPAENDAIKTGEHPRDSTWALDRAVPRAVPRLGHLDRLDAASSPPASPPTTAGRSGSSCGSSSAASPTATEAARPVVPEGPDGARQRAGDRRPLRALRHPGRAAQPGAVVLPDHRLRRPLLDDFGLLESWPEHVVTMQRNWIGRSEGAEVDLPLRGARPRLPGLHDPPRHALRRHVLRPRPRAPRPRAADRGHRERRRGPRLRRRGRCASSAERARRRGPREDRRPRSGAPSPTRSTARRSRCSSPTTC